MIILVKRKIYGEIKSRIQRRKPQEGRSWPSWFILWAQEMVQKEIQSHFKRLGKGKKITKRENHKPYRKGSWRSSFITLKRYRNHENAKQTRSQTCKARWTKGRVKSQNGSNWINQKRKGETRWRRKGNQRKTDEKESWRVKESCIAV